MDKKSVYIDLRRRIVVQELKPGQPLVEKELMERYGIGRTPLRDIFLDLQRDGLITVIARYGTFVTALSPDELRNIVELRSRLEAFVGEILCQRITPADLKQIESIILQCESAIQMHANGDDPKISIEKLLELEGAFHLQTYYATQNAYLIEVLRKLQANTMRFWHYLSYDFDTLKQQFVELRNIYNAIAAKDVELSKRLLSEHITHFADGERLTSLTYPNLYMF